MCYCYYLSALVTRDSLARLDNSCTILDELGRHHKQLCFLPTTYISQVLQLTSIIPDTQGSQRGVSTTSRGFVDNKSSNRSTGTRGHFIVAAASKSRILCTFLWGFTRLSYRRGIVYGGREEKREKKCWGKDFSRHFQSKQRLKTCN